MNDYTNILLHSIILLRGKMEIFMLNDCTSITLPVLVGTEIENDEHLIGKKLTVTHILPF